MGVDRKFELKMELVVWGFGYAFCKSAFCLQGLFKDLFFGSLKVNLKLRSFLALQVILGISCSCFEVFLKLHDKLKL